MVMVMVWVQAMMLVAVVGVVEAVDAGCVAASVD